VPAEFNKRPFKPGTVGLSRGPSPDSGSCQFFICLARNPQWDGEYTAFAEVVEGLDVARKISEAQTHPKHNIAQMRERPIREQLIESIRIERRKL
jgi:peptidyl-prolyl cis-trans isomerase B (cyclophilin B)